MFVPLYDGVPLRYLRYPLANWSIIAVNAFMFLWLQSAPDTGRVETALGVFRLFFSEPRCFRLISRLSRRR